MRNEMTLKINLQLLYLGHGERNTLSCKFDCIAACFLEHQNSIDIAVEIASLLQLTAAFFYESHAPIQHNQGLIIFRFVLQFGYLMRHQQL